MLSRHHLSPTIFLHPRPFIPQAPSFHTAVAWRTQSPNHYETLGLEPNVPAATIKKKFYQLSKTHHPDHNPDDPAASDRFVKISEAYAVLGSPQRRERYDRDIQRAQAEPLRNAPRGSHSSSSTPFGSRPASGLSRRRTQFRGPPPSFYRSGGWGQYGGKRQAQADSAASAAAGEFKGGGFGPGQGQADSGNDVPHFDREGHSRTQEQQDQRRRRRLDEESIGYSEGGSTLVKFAVIAAVVTFAFSIPGFFDTKANRPRRKEES